MTTAVLPFHAPSKEPLAMRAPVLAAVMGMHAAVVAAALQARFDAPPDPVFIPLDVRMIEVPMPAPQAVPSLQPAPSPLIPKPAQPIVRPRAAQPLPQTPIQADTTSPAVEASPAPAVQPREQVAVASAASAPPAPARVVETAARYDADYLQNPAPEYPPMSRRLREEGKVMLLVKVTPNGEAEQVQIKEGSGFRRLDEAALNVVQRWRFVPARRGDVPISASVVVPIVFSLAG